MPRIEVRPIGLAKDDGSPTVDVCKGCAKKFGKQGETLGDTLADDIWDRIMLNLPSDSVVGSLDVEHPTYVDSGSDCDCCGRTLSEVDN